MSITLGRVLAGQAGEARELIYEWQPDDPLDYKANIGTWFVDAPNQSPFWRHFVLAAIHLRPIPGSVKPPVKREPDVTHEFILVALDPGTKPDPLDPDTWAFLRPYNLTEQVSLPNDATCAALLELCADGIVTGKLWAEPPLSGQVEPWRSFLRVMAPGLGGPGLGALPGRGRRAIQ